MGRIKSLIFCLVVLASCQHDANPKASFFRSLTDTMNFDHHANLLIYNVNPNDCLNCVNTFRTFNEDLNDQSNNKLYVIAVEREIEKKTLSSQLSEIHLTPGPHKNTIWSKDIFDKICQITGNGLPLTSICVYDFKLDSIIFSSPIREISDEQQVLQALQKNH